MCRFAPLKGTVSLSSGLTTCRSRLWQSMLHGLLAAVCHTRANLAASQPQRRQTLCCPAPGGGADEAGLATEPPQPRDPHCCVPSHAQPTEPASRAGGEHRLSARASQGRPIWPHCTRHLTRACQQRLQRRPPVRVTVAALTAAPRRRRHRSCFTCRARRPNCEPVSRLGSC